MKNKNLKKYLIGKTDNLIGSILGFKRGKLKGNLFKANSYLSFFLYTPE
jgi:hypothetical protein